MKYKVRITETLIKDIEVTASSKEEAEIIARNKYKNEEIILYPEDHINTDFETINEVKKNEFER